MFVKKTTLLSAAVLLALAACGDSSQTVAPTITASKGLAVDGYLNGATVTCVGTGVTTTTDATGNFTFSPLCASAISVANGINIDTGFPFNGTLKAPAGAAVSSPLTTLVTGLSADDTAKVLKNLGITAGSDLTKLDPVLPENFAVQTKTLAMQQIAQRLADTFAKLLGASATQADIYAKVAEALGKQLAASTTPLFDASGNIDTGVLNTMATAAVAASGVTISAADLTAMSNSIGLEAQQFSTATSAAGLLKLSTTLQDPKAAPIDATAASKYLTIAADTLSINGTQPVTLSAFQSGISINNLTTIGIPFNAVGAPAVDTVSAVFLELNEEGGKGRKLQVMIDKVAFKLTAGVLSVVPVAGAKVFVFGHTANGSDINLTLSDLAFNPLKVSDNNLTLNFDSIMKKATAADTTTSTTADKFTNITGIFATKIVVSNLNLRHADGSAFSNATASISGTTTAPTIAIGVGITGKLTLTP